MYTAYRERVYQLEYTVAVDTHFHHRANSTASDHYRSLTLTDEPDALS